MSDKTKSEILERRGALLAELLLQDMGAEFVARPAADLGYDFFVGFNNPEGGVNIAAAEVKATEKPVHSHYRVKKQVFRRLANSNVPVVLLVVNGGKRQREPGVLCAPWADRAHRRARREHRFDSCYGRSTRQPGTSSATCLQIPPSQSLKC